MKTMKTRTEKQKRQVNPATDRRFKVNRVPKVPVVENGVPVNPDPRAGDESWKEDLPCDKRSAEWAAARTLADVVAEYVENDYPVWCLTGYNGNRPDPYWIEKIAEALEIMGYSRAPAKLRALLV